MTRRTTPDEVKIIIATNLSDDEIGGFIGDASSEVDYHLSGKLPDYRLEKIERYWTAHLISISRERQAANGQGEASRVTFTGEYEMGLTMTSYGQAVLDFADGLLDHLTKPTPSFHVPDGRGMNYTERRSDVL